VKGRISLLKRGVAKEKPKMTRKIVYVKTSLFS